MKTPARSASPRRSIPRATIVTLGDLITAAYDAVPGADSQKVRQALALLTASPLARAINPHVVFTR